MSGRRIVIELKGELSRFLEQEKSRLRTQYGLVVSNPDIVRVLLEQHRLRVVSAAGEDEAILWYHQKLKEREIDSSPSSTDAAIATEDTPKGARGRKPKKW